MGNAWGFLWGCCGIRARSVPNRNFAASPSEIFRHTWQTADMAKFQASLSSLLLLLPPLHLFQSSSSPACFNQRALLSLPLTDMDGVAGTRGGPTGLGRAMPGPIYRKIRRYAYRRFHAETYILVFSKSVSLWYVLIKYVITKLYQQAEKVCIDLLEVYCSYCLIWVEVKRKLFMNKWRMSP